MLLPVGTIVHRTAKHHSSSGEAQLSQETCSRIQARRRNWRTRTGLEPRTPTRAGQAPVACGRRKPYFVNWYDFLAVEDLSVRYMMANHPLAKSMHDAAWSQFADALSYQRHGPVGDISLWTRVDESGLLWLWAAENRSDARRPYLHLRPLWAGHRPRPQRGQQHTGAGEGTGGIGTTMPRFALEAPP
jgi:hypothetical protein